RLPRVTRHQIVRHVRPRRRRRALHRRPAPCVALLTDRLAAPGLARRPRARLTAGAGARPSGTVTVMRPGWSPTAAYLQRSRLRRFAESNGHPDFVSLMRWSVEDMDGFWRATARDLGIVWRVPYENVLDTSRGIPWTT